MIEESVGDTFRTTASQMMRIMHTPTRVMTTGTITLPAPRSDPASTSMNTYTTYQGVISRSMSQPIRITSASDVNSRNRNARAATRKITRKTDTIRSINRQTRVLLRTRSIFPAP